MESLPATAAAHPFGKYSLVARLATGGMAEIFLARLQGAAGFEKLVCIKRILPHLARDRQFVAMFLDEARIAARITHPNVCQVFELDRLAVLRERGLREPRAVDAPTSSHAHRHAPAVSCAARTLRL